MRVSKSPQLARKQMDGGQLSPKFGETRAADLSFSGPRVAKKWIILDDEEDDSDKEIEVKCITDFKDKNDDSKSVKTIKEKIIYKNADPNFIFKD